MALRRHQPGAVIEQGAVFFNAVGRETSLQAKGLEAHE
jgi:hypothetical protein